jgi:hypothetical protein
MGRTKQHLSIGHRVQQKRAQNALFSEQDGWAAFFLFSAVHISRSHTGCTCESIGLQSHTRTTISSNPRQDGKMNDICALASVSLPRHASFCTTRHIWQRAFVSCRIYPIYSLLACIYTSYKIFNRIVRYRKYEVVPFGRSHH